tara:strand:- start:3184 stop:4167 length:984 start_codon:yes stop_codon:yes gene_type:complete
MSKYITTYFYHDIDDIGASYGNIFLPLKQRNLVYWQTVYTLFFTSIVKNRHEKIKYALFTNVSSFPLRNEIESLGVVIFDDLKLVHRNTKEWATVKFFFDVVTYIENSSYFKDDDSIVMLDTDCIGLNSSAKLFTHLEKMDQPAVYFTGYALSAHHELHGLSIRALEKVFEHVFLRKIFIRNTIGGEFFAFNKNKNLKDFRRYYENLLEAQTKDTITTEEQILSIINGDMKFLYIDFSIYRIWTAYRNYDVCNDINKFTFLHLPSEKTNGLASLFKQLIKKQPLNFTSDALDKVIYQHIPINNPIKLYAMKILNDIKIKIYDLFQKR